MAPDDNPEFLRSLDSGAKEDRELFEQWEADLKRREDELRREEELRKEQEDPPRS